MVFQCLATHLRIVSNTLIYRYSILCSSVSSSIASHTSDRMCRAVDVVSIVDDPIFMWTVTFNTPLLHLMALSNILFDKQSGYKRNSDRFIRWISLLFDCSIFVFLLSLYVCVCARMCSRAEGNIQHSIYWQSIRFCVGFRFRFSLHYIHKIQ